LSIRVWHTVAGDFYGPMADGNYWFVNICEHSQWASVDKVRRTDEEHTEKVLERLFNTFGAPVVYKSDNVSPFQSHRFSEFAKKWGFKHRRVTPEWPRANGKAESFMKKLGKVLRTSNISGQHKEQALYEFLRAYRETPHSTTGVAPNHLMFGCSRSSDIPSMLPETSSQREAWRLEAMANDARSKKRMKEEYDSRMKAKESLVRVGAKVVIKVKRSSKADPAWDIERPYEVVAVKGSMVTASRDGHTTTRNSSFFKPYRELTYEDESPGNQLPERREEAPPTGNLVPASAEQPRPLPPLPQPQSPSPRPQPPSPRTQVPRPPSPRLQEPPPQPPEASEPRRSERVRTKTVLFSNELPSKTVHSKTVPSKTVPSKTLPSKTLPSNATPSKTSHGNASQPGVSFLSKKGGKMWCPLDATRQQDNNNDNNNNNKNNKHF
jgi:hypothetical protein